MRSLLLLSALPSLALAQEPVHVLAAPTGAIGFGHRVGALGDVDGDGVPDAAVADRAGTVRVYSGATFALLGSIGLGTHHVAGLSAVDVDGDGVREVVVAHQDGLVGAQVWVEAFDVATGALLWSYYDFQFGGEDEVRFDVLPDRDGDGREDLLVGMPDQDIWHPAWWQSSVKILSSANGGRLWERTHDPEGFGEGLAGLDDLDGDGWVEFAVGSRSAIGIGGLLRGSVTVLSGNVVLWSLDGSHPLSELGEDLVAIGDRDGDGHEDLVALETLPSGASSAASTLRLRALSGIDGAPLGARDFPGEAFPGIANEAELEPFEDLDGDGVRELVLVVPVSGVHGRAEVRVLSGATFETRHAWSVDLQAVPGATGATTAAMLGDLDLDGAPELLVGRPDAPGGGRVLLFSSATAVGTLVCAATTPTSSGRPAGLWLGGSLAVAASDLDLLGHDLPPSTWVLPVVGSDPAFVPQAGGSAGTLCVGGDVRRLGALVARADAGGAYARALDLAAFHPTPPTALMPGETWHFQLWFRDAGTAGATSNFSDARAATFQ